MYNWNDIEVEQKIAQERYQVIVQGRQIVSDKPVAASHDHRTPSWLKHLVRAWKTYLHRGRPHQPSAP